jgi:hypothetical protein
LFKKFYELVNIYKLVNIFISSTFSENYFFIHFINSWIALNPWQLFRTISLSASCSTFSRNHFIWWSIF